MASPGKGAQLGWWAHRSSRLEGKMGQERWPKLSKSVPAGQNSVQAEGMSCETHCEITGDRQTKGFSDNLTGSWHRTKQADKELVATLKAKGSAERLWCGLLGSE